MNWLWLKKITNRKEIILLYRNKSFDQWSTYCFISPQFPKFRFQWVNCDGKTGIGLIFNCFLVTQIFWYLISLQMNWTVLNGKPKCIAWHIFLSTYFFYDLFIIDKFDHISYIFVLLKIVSMIFWELASLS